MGRSRLTELVILVGGGSINMSRRWRWETQRVNNTKNRYISDLRPFPVVGITLAEPDNRLVAAEDLPLVLVTQETGN